MIKLRRKVAYKNAGAFGLISIRNMSNREITKIYVDQADFHVIVL